MVVRSLEARTGDGTANVTGTIQLAPPVRSLDLNVRVNDFFAVKQTAYEATVSGDVKIGGNLDAPDVTGTLQVEHALVRPSALPASEPVVPDDATIVVVGRPVRAVEAAAAGPTIGESMRLAVTIEVQRNAWIRRNDAEIELGGKLEVRKEPGKPLAITGDVQLVRGWYAFQGRRFQLEPGSRIVFGGQSPPAPTFDITASYTAQEYRIEVHITGSADKPNLELTSTPALEKADILAVLLFGKRTQDLGRGESSALQQQALALAAGYVVPELRTSVMNTLGLETLDVQMPEGVQPGKVSAGRYVSDDVFVSLGQEFGRRAAQVVGLEYYLGRNVSVRASTSTRGDSAVDLLWRYRY
jgi:translocation and assembly module TamB